MKPAVLWPWSQWRTLEFPSPGPGIGRKRKCPIPLDSKAPPIIRPDKEPFRRSARLALGCAALYAITSVSPLCDFGPIAVARKGAEKTATVLFKTAQGTGR